MAFLIILLALLLIALLAVPYGVDSRESARDDAFTRDALWSRRPLP
jgi:hypothetical protein